MLHQRTAKWNRSNGGRSGFTLTELLVVIAIIAVIAGISLPAIFAARRSFDQNRLKIEVQNLDEAVKKYFTQFGDYPPDGSSWVIVERHLRKAFPEILSTELAIIAPSNVNLPVMDRAEALVFFLGGFSSNKQKPLSGKGGPFINAGTAASPSWVLNPNRENALFDFVPGRLLDQNSNQLPTYNVTDVSSPYAYFDSRTYVISRTAGMELNLFEDSVAGAVRPLLVQTPLPTPAQQSANYENAKTFQIHSPGLDGLYGFNNGGPTAGILFNVRGQGFNVNLTTTPQYQSNGAIFSFKGIEPKNRAVDNVSNCVETTTLGQNTTN